MQESRRAFFLTDDADLQSFDEREDRDRIMITTNDHVEDAARVSKYSNSSHGPKTMQGGSRFRLSEERCEDPLIVSLNAVVSDH
jgi:hypothetical protein